MKITCPYGHNEFSTDVTARVEVFVQPDGKIVQGFVNDIIFLPDKAHPAQTFICTSCGERAEVEHP